MSSYVRTQITGRLATLLATITTANGYNTSIGDGIAVADIRRNAHESPGVVIVPGAERIEPEYGVDTTVVRYQFVAVVNRLETTISGYASAPTAEWVIVDAMIRDIRKLLGTYDETLDGLTEGILYQGTGQPYYSTDGGELIGIDVNYDITFSISDSDPDNPI